MSTAITRRDFIKLSAISLGTLGARPWARLFDQPDFPQAERLGRVVVGKADLKARPDVNSQTVGILFEDAIVHYLLKTPTAELPQTSLGAGMWMEVSVPYVDLILSNPTARAPWFKNRIESGLPARFFYSQIA